MVSEASVAWAAAVLLSRAFSLDMSEPDMSLEADMSYFGSWQAHQPDVLALVPWADMLAHSSEAGKQHENITSQLMLITRILVISDQTISRGGVKASSRCCVSTSHEGHVMGLEQSGKTCH